MYNSTYIYVRQPVWPGIAQIMVTCIVHFIVHYIMQCIEQCVVKCITTPSYMLGPQCIVQSIVHYIATHTSMLDPLVWPLIAPESTTVINPDPTSAKRRFIPVTSVTSWNLNFLIIASIETWQSWRISCQNTILWWPEDQQEYKQKPVQLEDLILCQNICIWSKCRLMCCHNFQSCQLAQRY